MPELFKKTLARIAAKAARPADAPSARPEAPESFGWLRRPDLDRVGVEAWELPDGEIRLTRPQGPDVSSP